MSHQKESYLCPLSECLQTLQRMLRVALPLPPLVKATKHPPLASVPAGCDGDANTSSSLGLQRLLDLLFVDDDIADMKWCSWIMYDAIGSKDRIASFQQQLGDWKSSNCQFLLAVEPKHSDAYYTITSWADFAIPPSPAPPVSPRVCLASALYYFAIARATWAKSLLSNGGDDHERNACLYFYWAMRCVATISTTSVLLSEKESIYPPARDFTPACYQYHI
jgi:hypothetical protein